MVAPFVTPVRVKDREFRVEAYTCHSTSFPTVEISPIKEATSSGIGGMLSRVAPAVD